MELLYENINILITVTALRACVRAIFTQHICCRIMYLDSETDGLFGVLDFYGHDFDIQVTNNDAVYRIHAL